MHHMIWCGIELIRLHRGFEYFVSISGVVSSLSHGLGPNAHLGAGYELFIQYSCFFLGYLTQLRKLLAVPKGDFGHFTLSQI